MYDEKRLAKLILNRTPGAVPTIPCAARAVDFGYDDCYCLPVRYPQLKYSLSLLTRSMVRVLWLR